MTKDSKIVLLARLMRASGQTWEHIKHQLYLSDKQCNDLRAKISTDNYQYINEANAEDAFATYEDILRKCLRELQNVLQVTNKPELKLAAIKQKVEIAEKLINTGHEINIWQQQPAQLTVETTRRISATGDNLVRNIMQRLTNGSEPTRALESGIEESGDFGTTR